MATATLSRRYAGRMPVAPARKTGNWKMAYADFLTALMAFFLLMWLISGVSPEERAAIASQFNNTEATGTLVTSNTTVSEADRLFSALTLQQDLQAAGDSVMLTREPDGVRIDLTDRAGRPLFDTGNGRFTVTGHKLTEAVGQTLANFPQSLTIEGHTDAFGSDEPGFSNWDLSSDRANEARRILNDAGITPDRLRAVAGLAASRPLLPGQPHLSANRRVSILVHIDR